MKEYTILRSTLIRRPIMEVFGFFSNAENLGRLTPPELGFRIRSPLPIEMRTGALIDYTIKLYGLPLQWRTEITRWNPPHSFEDTQLAGPYAKWVHTHRFVGNGRTTTVEDQVVYALPLGPIGRIVHPVVGKQLKRVFDYRQSVLAKLFE